ncbi:MAG TPA: CoA pyrophosphatase [Micromonosporaceae bacterium]|nr:CoA pyrophosphatase [Micromonosporaceae bacterium]
MTQPRRESAVLLPVYRDDAGVLRIVLVRRTERGQHAGQLALPGGSREPGDADLVATALREAYEEIGLSPDDVQVLAELPAVDTRTTGFSITPVLARITSPEQRWRLSADEIAGVVDVAVTDLADPALRGEELMSFPSWPEPRTVPVIALGDELLWGVTLRILEPVVPRLLADEWPV